MNRYMAIVFFLLAPIEAWTADFQMELDHCTRKKGKVSLVYDCKMVTKKDISINVRKPSGRNILTGSDKKSVFRQEFKIGSHRIAIGAWKPDPIGALTVMNISLTEVGKGQIDYNETSFFDDKNGNYLSIALRSNSQSEYYRLKLRQKAHTAAPPTDELE